MNLRARGMRFARRLGCGYYRICGCGKLRKPNTMPGHPDTMSQDEPKASKPQSAVRATSLPCPVPGINPGDPEDAWREAPFYRDPAMRRILLLLGLCWAFEFGARVLYTYLDLPPLTRDLLGMGAFGVLIVATYYVLFMVRTTPLVHRTLMLALAVLVVSQLSDVVDETEWAQNYVLLAKESQVHLMLEHMIFITGCLLMVTGSFFAIVEGERARGRLRREHQLLVEAVAEREAARQELARNSARLEEEVAARTEELARTNAQLRVELAERRRAEESLAMRLRYEEGLSSCSQMLLSSEKPHEAMTHALEELLAASRAARVYLFENFEDPARGLCARLTHEAWSPQKAPDCLRAPGMELVYDAGLEDIRWELAQGRPCMGPLTAFPISVRKAMQEFGTKSLLLLPLTWEGGWRGFLGFDETAEPRVWSPEEVRMLRTAAEMVGACRERQIAEDALRSAYGELETRVAERTADLREANAHLQREIAERQRAEEETVQLGAQLRQAQKLQAIGTLAGGIAHDFNNILASILGYSELALQKPGADARHRRYFEEILKAGNRAKELVRQILLFSRQAEQDIAPLHPHLVVKEVLAMVRVSRPANVDIRHHIDGDAGMVLADPLQLHQAVLHLCNNALHAVRDTGGVIELRIEPVRVAEGTDAPRGDVAPGDYVLITVSDTGSGMDASTLDRIFDPFFTTKDIGEGTGLGLSMVHGIVTSIGGVITAQSAPRQGTTIRVYLPRCARAEDAENAAPRHGPRGNERVLVVDDEAPLVILWTELLEQLGYRVTSFADPRAAHDAFRIDPESFDMALLDQRMPGMEGSELARRLLELRPDLPIIIATGFSESITAETAKAIGVRDVVLKPILGSDLGAAVRRALDGAPPAEASPARGA